jgi:predicted transcriptional regulator
MGAGSDIKAKRSQFKMLAEVLELCRKPTTKTQIMHKTNMSYSGMQKFLRHLLKFELLRPSDDSTKYITTEKGLEFIRRYAGLQDQLK